ncbi:MAG: DUF1501 domain-containing protein [Planctomycetes bacterium]|nr:DUF1501 domain-containing protein [Planctomycetota bacterium]
MAILHGHPERPEAASSRPKTRFVSLDDRSFDPQTVSEISNWLRWGRVDEWVLKEFRGQILDAVRRDCRDEVLARYPRVLRSNGGYALDRLCMSQRVNPATILCGSEGTLGLIAGGGLRTGQVIGATNRTAGSVISRAVHYKDVFATLYRTLGIDAHRTTIIDPRGRPQYLLDGGEPLRELV